MAGATKLMTSGAGGVILTPTGTLSSDITVNLPTAGVSGGTLVCSDSAGNVGIGTSSPSAPLTIVNSSVGEVLRLTSTNANIYGVASDGTIQSYTGGVLTGIGGFVGTVTNHPYIFRTNNTERMRIDSSGNLLVGKTADNSANQGWIVYPSGTAQYAYNSAGTVDAYQFYRSNTKVGYISTTASATSYSTSSDYRLKENVKPMQNALGVVAQLNPVTYTWKADGSDGQGFIAHELQAVVPDCVTGEKDAVDAEGKPVYQGIDTSFLVATLTKAIQEQQAQIKTLTAKVAALEAK